jgi:hypothetical protein
VPLSARWPPRGSSGGRWRCRCLPAAPEGVAFGRWLALGDASACWVGPRGGPPSGRWLPLPSCCPRGGGCLARASGPVCWRLAAPRSCVVPVVVPVAAPRSCRWCRVWRRCLQTPCGSAFPRPRGGLVCRSRGPARRAPEGGWVAGPGRACCRSSEEVRGGSWGARGWRCCLSEEWRRCRRPLSAWPRGVRLTVAPGGRCGLFRGEPRPVRFACRASSFRGRMSALHRGCDASRRVKERLAAPPRRCGRVPRLLRWRRGAGGALRVPLRGLPRPRGGLVARCGVASFFRSAQGPFGAPALPKRGGCRCGVSLFAPARGLARVPALPKRGGADTPGPPRWTGFPVPPRRCRGAPAVARGCVPLKARAPRRLAFGLPLRAEARAGSSLSSRGWVGRGGESSFALSGEPPFASEGAFLVRNAPGRRVPSAESWYHWSLKGWGHVKEQPEGCCR